MSWVLGGAARSALVPAEPGSSHGPRNVFRNMNGFTPVLLGKDEPDTGRTVQVFICCNKGGERNLEGNSSFQLLHGQTWGGKRDDFMVGKARLVAVIAGSARVWGSSPPTSAWGGGHSHRRGWLEPSSSPWHQLQGQQNRVTRNGEGDTTCARTRLLNSRSSAGAPPREWGGSRHLPRS